MPAIAILLNIRIHVGCEYCRAINPFIDAARVDGSIHFELPLFLT